MGGGAIEGYSLFTRFPDRVLDKILSLVSGLP